MSEDKLSALREEIAQLDRQIFELAAQRNRIAEAIGQVKTAAHLPQRDYAQEKAVVERAHSYCRELGLDPKEYEPIILTLIRASTTIEERGRLSALNSDRNKKVLVIGGAGKMGGWMISYLEAQGITPVSVDPAGDVPGVENHRDWRALDLDIYDAIIVAPPLRYTNDVLLELAERKPRGVIFDVGSLKSPLRSGIQALREAGLRVTSIHPMFGPDVELLSGRHIIFIDCGHDEALAWAHALFSNTTAVRVDMTLDEHDQLIAYVLGLSHATNIAFFTALAESGQAAPRLARMSSSTFDAQLNVAAKVAEENPWLYYDIQALNDFGMDALDSLKRAVDAVHTAIRTKNTDQFVNIMLQGRNYLNAREVSEDVLKR